MIEINDKFTHQLLQEEPELKKLRRKNYFEYIKKLQQYWLEEEERLKKIQ